MQHTIGLIGCCDFWRHLEGGQDLMKVENVERVRAVIWLDKASDPAYGDTVLEYFGYQSALHVPAQSSVP